MNAGRWRKGRVRGNQLLVGGRRRNHPGLRAEFVERKTPLESRIA